jgi:hypothetical protein
MENIIKSSPYTNFDIQRTITNRLLSLSKGTHTPNIIIQKNGSQIKIYNKQNKTFN